MEDEAVSAAARHAAELADNNSLLSSIKSSVKSPTHSTKSSGSKKSNKKNGSAGRNMKLEEMIDEAAKVEDKFTGHSCLLITWKTNPEVELFKVNTSCHPLHFHRQCANKMTEPQIKFGYQISVIRDLIKPLNISIGAIYG